MDKRNVDDNRGIITISCSDPNRIVGELDRLMPQLSRDVCRTLNSIKIQLLAHVGKEGLHQRVNNRTVEEVIAEFGSTNSLTIIEEGELDGTKYKLYGPAIEQDDDT